MTVSHVPGRLAAAILAVSGVVLAQTYRIEIVSGSIADHPATALRDGRLINIESRSLEVRSIDPSDAVTIHELVLFREPDSGQFVFVSGILHNRFGALARSGDLAANTRIAFDGEAMRAFSYGRFSLLIRKSTARYPSMAMAQTNVIAEFGDYVQRHEEQMVWSEDESWITLWERLPKGLTGHVGDLLLPPTRLRDFARTGACWRMVLDGPIGESTPIAIDDSYDLASPEACSHSQPPIRHVQLAPGTEGKLSAPAIENGRQTTIDLHYAMAKIIFPDGQMGRLSLRMLYDPGSQLFWWHFSVLHPTQPDSQVETEAQQFLGAMSVYVAKDRIVVFSTASASESSARYPTLDAARSAVLSVLETMHGSIQAWRGLPVHALDLSGIPSGFFHQCGHAEMGLIRLTQVDRAGALWRLTLAGANGNSAVVALKDNYETVDVRLSPEQPPAQIERVVQPETIAAQRDGKPVKLELREVRIRHPFDCGSMVSRVVLIFDPSSHLSWWTELDSTVKFHPAIYETQDSIVVVSLAMASIEVRDSSARAANWSDLQSHVWNLLWRGVSNGCHYVELSKQLPEAFLRQPEAGPPQISLKDGLWQILAAATNGQTAAIRLDNEYRLVDATLRP